MGNNKDANNKDTRKTQELEKTKRISKGVNHPATDK